MSSSDDDWMPQARPSAASSGQSSMMDARRRALQQQREAQQQQQQQQQQQRQKEEAARRPQTSGRNVTRPPELSAAPSAKAESALPDFLADLDGDGDATGVAASELHSPSQPTLIFPAGSTTPPSSSAQNARGSHAGPPAQSSAQSHESTVEELQRQIAAKRKLLESTKAREAALVEKWRLTKAQKQAEVEQLNGKIRRVWAALEDAKSAAETKTREAQDEHEAELRAARRRVEQEVKADYEAKLAEAQQQLASAKAEEARLRALLEGTDGSSTTAQAAKDVVNTALTAAITAVVHRLDDVFESEGEKEEAGGGGLRMEAWRAELEALVQREVRTSFAVGVESEAQAERDEYGRFFRDMLAFWRSAEDQERERLLKMDETLLADLQAMAQQDLRRLQEEELAMERVYVESREAWALEHQRLLQRELEAALQRREGELQEQRRQRHELHLERLRDCEARHAEMLAREEALHQQKMKQLHMFFGREEGLRAEQQRVEAAARESVAQAAAQLRGVMATAEEAAVMLAAYERGVDEARRQVEGEREAYLAEQATLLEQLQGLAATQCSNTDAERAALEDCASRLRVATQTVVRHLQEEDAWLAQQESAHRRSRDEWEREFHRWQQLVQQERQAAEERFHEALAELQKSMQLLEAEEREVGVEQSALQRTFAEVEAAAQREVEALQRRAVEVQSRSVALAELRSQLEQQREAAAGAKAELAQAEQRLEEEAAELRADEERLRDMAEALHMARSQAMLRGGPGHLLRNAPALQSEAVRGQPQHTGGRETEPVDTVGPSRKGGAGATAAAAAAGVAEKKKRRHRSDPHRLPNRIFRELDEQLQQLSRGGGSEAFVPTLQWTDPASVRHPRVNAHATGEEEGRPRRHRVPPQHSGSPQARDAIVPPPLSASPQLVRQDRRTRAQQATPQPRHGQAAPASQRRPARHADPSSLPVTSASSPALSLRGDGDWSPSANTFTNLVDFSDADTTSQSFQ